MKKEKIKPREVFGWFLHPGSVSKSAKDWGKDHTPEDIEEEIGFMDEFFEDIHNGAVVGWGLRLGLASWLISWLGMGYLWGTFHKTAKGKILLGTVLKAGFHPFVQFMAIAFALIAFWAVWTFYRQQKRSELRYKNYYISKHGTYGNAHFQTQAELEKNFHVFDSWEECPGQVMFADDQGRYYSMKDDAMEEIFKTKEKGHRRNNYAEIYCGGAGSGKSASIVKADLYQDLKRGVSVVLTDTKGDLYRETSAVVRSFVGKDGKHPIVKVLNFKREEFKNSDGFNPLVTVYPGNSNNTETARGIAGILIQASGLKPDGDNLAFYNAGVNLLVSLILFVSTTETEVKLGHNTIAYIFELLTQDDEQLMVTMGIDYRPPTDPIRQLYLLYYRASDNFKGNVRQNLGSAISIFIGETLSKVLSNNEIDLTLPLRRQCVYYVIIEDTDTTFAPLAQLFFTLAMQAQVGYSDKLQGEAKKKQLRCHYILDEYKNFGGIDTINTILATVRSRKLDFTIILQDINQLYALYEEYNTSTIMNNCFCLCLLATNDKETATVFSELLGTQTVVSISEANEVGTAAVFRLRSSKRETRTENKRPLMLPEALMQGELPNDELIYIIQGMPPIKMKKPFAELGGTPIHPMEKESRKLGFKSPQKHKPKWRKAEEDALAEAQRKKEEYEKAISAGKEPELEGFDDEEEGAAPVPSAQAEPPVVGSPVSEPPATEPEAPSYEEPFGDVPEPDAADAYPDPFPEPEESAPEPVIPEPEPAAPAPVTPAPAPVRPQKKPDYSGVDAFEEEEVKASEQTAQVDIGRSSYKKKGKSGKVYKAETPTMKEAKARKAEYAKKRKEAEDAAGVW